MKINIIYCSECSEKRYVSASVKSLVKHKKLSGRCRKCLKIYLKNNLNSGCFKKGIIPWTKGKKGIHLSPGTEFKNGEFLGDKNPNWKGGKIRTKLAYVFSYVLWTSTSKIS